MVTAISKELGFKLCYFFAAAFGAVQARFSALYFSEKLRLNDSEVGKLLGISSIAQIFASSLGGILADKYFGRRNVFVISLIASAGVFGLYELLVVPERTTNLFLLKCYLIRFVSDIFNAAKEPLLDAEILQDSQQSATNAEDSQHLAKKRWGEARVYGSIGWAVSCLILGYIFDLTGSTTSLVQVSFITSFISAICAFSFFEPRKINFSVENVEMKQLKAEEREAPLNPADKALVQAAAKSFAEHFIFNPSGRSFTIVVFISSICMMLVEGLSFLYFREALLMSTKMMGYLVVITVAFELPLFHYSGEIVEYLGHDRMIVIGLVAYTTRVYVYTLLTPETSWLIVSVEWLHGITIGLIQTAGTLKFNEIAEDEYRSTFQGFLTALMAAGKFIGDAGGGKMFEIIGQKRTYQLSCVITLLITVNFMKDSKDFSFKFLQHSRLRHWRSSGATYEMVPPVQREGSLVETKDSLSPQQQN